MTERGTKTEMEAQGKKQGQSGGPCEERRGETSGKRVGVETPAAGWGAGRTAWRGGGESRAPGGPEERGSAQSGGINHIRSPLSSSLMLTHRLKQGRLPRGPGPGTG